MTEQNFLQREESFYLNQYKNIVKTDDGEFILQKVYEKNSNGEIVQTEESKNNKTKNFLTKDCTRCSYCLQSEDYKDYCMLSGRLAQKVTGDWAYRYTSWQHNCDAYDPLDNLNIIHSMDEMVSFIERTRDRFSCWENIEYYYGFSLLWNEDTGETTETIREYYNRGGKFEYVPLETEYPCVIYFNEKAEMLQWISIKKENENA